MNSLVSAFHRYVFKSSIFWWSVLLGNGLRFHLSKFRSSCSRGWCSASSSCSSSSSWPCLSITLWGWWKEEEKRPSPHIFSTAEFCSQSIFLSNYGEKNGMPSDPSVTGNVNCQRVLYILITLMVLSPVSANYKPAGDLSGAHWESWPPVRRPSCSEQQLQPAESEGQSHSQMLLTDSQHHRSQRTTGRFRVPFHLWEAWPLKHFVKTYSQCYYELRAIQTTLLPSS